MSGSRHHVIPRFLIKGFATDKKSGKGFSQSSKKSKKKNQQFYTVVHENNNIYSANINNVFVEKFFYGKKGEGEHLKVVKTSTIIKPIEISAPHL